MKVLVVGGSGLLGNKLVRLCLAKGLDVCATHKSSPQSPTIGGERIFLKLDITDRESAISKVSELKPDVIVNTAAMTNVDLCEVEKETAWKVNAEGAKNIAEACSKSGAFLVQVSTGYVFDGEKGSYDEGEEPNPIGYYGYTKLKGEQFVESNIDEWCIARTDVIFGWGRPNRPNFATWVIENLEKKAIIKTVTDQYNSPTLNTNLAEMIVEVAERKTKGILNLAGASRISRLDFAKKISETFNLDEKLIYPVKTEELNWKAKRPKDSSLNVSKAQRLLLHKPLSIDEALKTLKEERRAPRKP